jgi:site-specific DNA-methyltransferase (adenine-specific)
MHTIVNADAIEHLSQMADESVQCIVTSPPYFNQRDYGHDGQIGREASCGEFIERLVAVFHEASRVLRRDGDLWINVGDTYGLGKQLLGVPWRLALALQADGWLLRQDVIWHKPSPMPESVTDRCTKSHEYVFLFAKSPSYFYDAEAISEPSVIGKDRRNFGPQDKGDVRSDGNHRGTYQCDGTRNRRSVWRIASRPYKGAHFATMPPELAETCIKAGTSEHGCCPQCGTPWERITKRTKLKRPRPADYVKRTGEAGTGSSCANSVAGVAVKTLGWKQSCKCEPHEPVPCVVLDPFAGSGTTLAVAKSLGRWSVGIELNPEYIALAERRVAEAGEPKRKNSPQKMLF